MSVHGAATSEAELRERVAASFFFPESETGFTRTTSGSNNN